MAMLAILVIALVGITSAEQDLHLLWTRLQTTLPSADIQEAAAERVLQRLLPDHISSFQFQIVSLEACGGKACFSIDSHQSEGSIKISINGTTGVELCAGLYWYLKEYCGAHISWDVTGGTQIQTVPRPELLPSLTNGGIKRQRPVPWSYYQNVVTSSYSYVWWNWERWEKEIEWMALQGINLPLAFTGQETIWQKVFQEKFNLTKGELDDYFGGPAFLAWARMGNLHQWGGPLPQTWLDEQLILQKKIVGHMRALGMIAVLPAFSGNVPFAIKKRYPAANITRLPDWNSVTGNPMWCGTYLLQPTDPLFVEIGEAFISQQIKEYGGTQHVYNSDTFNENRPPTEDPLYIAALGAAVYAAMSAGDKNAIWLMQGWLFASDSTFWKPLQMRALLHSVPLGKMIVLDLFADVKPIWSSSNHFYGVPYIWCMLHNFGGNHEMYGRLDVIGSEPVAARISENSTMVGVGLCMEGIEHNPVVYELMAEMAFHSEKVDVKAWISNYSDRRYGKGVSGAQKAWQILRETVYNCSDGTENHNKDVIVMCPDVDASLPQHSITEQRRLLTETSSSKAGHLWYNPFQVKKALGYLLSASDALTSSVTYRYDLVDLTRQMLSKLANEIYAHILNAFSRGDIKQLRKQSHLFVELIADMDTLLASNDGFLLGPWLESAKSLATSEQEKQLYEWNARTQITMWFDNTKDVPSSIHDYANKMWSGLFQDYYLPRAAIYLTYLEQALYNGEAFPFHSWRLSWVSLTNKWQNSSNHYPTKSCGDSLRISRRLYQRYGPLV